MTIYRGRGRMEGIIALIVLIVLGFVILFQMSGSPENQGQVTSGTKEFNVICIDGVEYLYLQVPAGPGYLAPHLKTDGDLHLCGDAGEQAGR